MQDILLKGLQELAQTFKKNADKVAHVGDVVRRLEDASEQYPHDSVIRIMEDVFRKRASSNPHHIVTADEFNTVKQELWTLNPRTPINELFPDLMLESVAKQSPRSATQRANHLDDAIREVSPQKTDAQLVQDARSSVLQALKFAGISQVQTRFSKGLYQNYSTDGTPKDGVLMFEASVVTKAGESEMCIPVTLENHMIIPPQTFASGGMRYPLTRKGVSDFSIGIQGIELDNTYESEYSFGENEIRNIPTLDNTAQEILDQAKQRIYGAFNEAGVKNCQIKFGSFDVSEDEGSGVANFHVRIAASGENVSVPVMIEGDFVYSPNAFVSTSGLEYELSQEGISQYFAAVSSSDSAPIANRIVGDGFVRDLESSTNQSPLRQEIAGKIASSLKAFGAINPQVYFVTDSDSSDATTSAYISSFGSDRGQCHIAVPVTIRQGQVDIPSFFYSEDHQQYQFSSAGFQSYLSKRASIGPVKKTDYHGEKPIANLGANEIDHNSRRISRQEGFEDGERVLRPADNRFAKLIDGTRHAIAKKLETAGAINPQVFFNHSVDQTGSLHFGAAFKTNKGIKKASVSVEVKSSGLIEPMIFLGEDNKAYSFDSCGMEQYINAGDVPSSDLEKEITNKLSGFSFAQLRDFVKQALFDNDHKQVAAAIKSIDERFGKEAARNTMEDLLSVAAAKQEDFSTRCGSCPFYRSRSDSKSRTAEDMCLKFNTRMSGVKFGGSHKHCTLIKTGSQNTEESFDGSIMTSKIKLT